MSVRFRPNRSNKYLSGVIPIEEAKRINGNAKYAPWLTDDGLLRVEGWAREGLIDAQIAHNMGIAYSTFKDWLNRFPALLAALKKGKAPVDLEVENALLKRALGYEYEETTTEIEEIPTNKKDEDGNIIFRRKKHIRKTTKQVLPDVTAQIYWLNNRRTDRWRNRKAVEELPNEQAKNAPIYDLLRRIDDECGV